MLLFELLFIEMGIDPYHQLLQVLAGTGPGSGGPGLKLA